MDLAESYIAVRVGAMPDSTLVARRVGDVRWVICASPAYLKRRGTPADPSDLTAHDCIAYEGLELWRDWSFAGPRGEETVIIRPRYSVGTADAVISGARAGIGIACLISYQAADSIRDGSCAHTDRPIPTGDAGPNRPYCAAASTVEVEGLPRFCRPTPSAETKSGCGRVRAYQTGLDTCQSSRDQRKSNQKAGKRAIGADVHGATAAR